MASYTVHSTITIQTIVELPDDEQDIHFLCGDYAGDEISKLLKDVDFDFCDDYIVFDSEGNEVPEI
jgi:hypothetical protein